MATSDREQMSAAVPYHKRIAMGAKLDGTSIQGRGGDNQPAPAKRSSPSTGRGALSQLKSK